jgi:hypothetical protein
MNRKQFLKSSILAPLATLIPVSAKAEEITHEIFFPDEKRYFSIPSQFFNCYPISSRIILNYEQPFSEKFKGLFLYHGTVIKITNLTDKQIEELKEYGVDLVKSGTKDVYSLFGGRWKRFLFKKKDYYS